ncbi:MAG: uroporphyrinogen-III C-methyltransferase [Anaerohalosphaera sp.]|nr:uroporphyrinogen-III C-methyltransferase [Anaerohalosphaera sp.]
MSKGKVYLVGAGPGDTGLITVRGQYLLKNADTILYDHLSSPELLSLAKPSAELISVGKFAGRHTMPQAEINQLLVDKAKQYKMVVRLKGGDCYIFGRGGEEVETCFEQGVPFEVIPGVTSAFAAPCYAGIPPTHRDCTSNVAIVTGHRKKGDNRPIDIPIAGTIVFLMSVSNIENIISSLLAADFPATTPIAAVEHGTCYDQRVITGTLENFLDILAKKPLRTPALFIVGKVVEMKEKLDWFEKKPRILLLGISAERYRELGTIIHRPIISCRPIQNNAPLTNAVKSAGDYDWLIFTSANAIKFFFEALYANGLDSRTLANTKIAAIGKATARSLSNHGLRADICPKTESSTGLLEEFDRIDITGKKLLLPQARIATEQLPTGLTEMGADVTKIDAYKTIEVDPGEIDFDYIDQVLFTSGSSVHAFINKFGKLPENVKAICLGKPTQAIAKENGIDAEIVKV